MRMCKFVVKIISWNSFFLNATAKTLAIGFRTLTASVAASDITDNTQSAGDVMTSLLL